MFGLPSTAMTASKFEPVVWTVRVPAVADVWMQDTVAPTEPQDHGSQISKSRLSCSTPGNRVARMSRRGSRSSRPVDRAEAPPPESGKASYGGGPIRRNVALSPKWVVLFTVFLDLLGFGIIIPVAPYFALFFGATALEVTALMASYAAMQFLFAPLWGRISDKVGRRPVMLVSIVGSAASYVIFAYADSILVLLVSRLVMGIMNANIAVAQAYLADVTSVEKRASSMGLLGAAFGAGFVLGPAIGGVAYNVGGFTGPALLAAGLAGLNFVLAFLFLPESRTVAGMTRARANKKWVDAAGLSAARRESTIGLLVILFFLMNFAYSNLESTFVLFANASPQIALTNPAEIAIVLVYTGVLTVIMQTVVLSRVNRRFSEHRMIVLGTFLLIFGFGVMPFSPNVLSLLAVLALFTFGGAITNPSVQSLLSKLAHEDERGAVLGFAQSMGSLGRVFGPLWGGWIFDYLDYHAPYLTAAAVMALVSLASFRLLRKTAPIPPPVAAVSP